MAEFNLISEQHTTQSSLKSLFEFLTDFKNFESILPLDKIENFSAQEDSCSFSIKGITPLTIKIKEKKPFDWIIFSSEGLAKFNFNLKVFFIGESILTGACKIELFGNLNPFIKTMAEKPLTALINTMSFKLSQLNLNT